MKIKPGVIVDVEKGNRRAGKQILVKELLKSTNPQN
jgi:hypothetical protein